MPSRFIRYGLSVFFLIIIGLLTGLYFIQYPDTFSTSVLIFENEQYNESIIDTKDTYVAHITIDANDIWKVKHGSTVNIKLNQYPSNIYGQLIGNIIQIIYNDKLQVYDVYIQLPYGLTTSFDKKINYLHEMSGIAFVKGKYQSILKRIFTSILSDN